MVLVLPIFQINFGGFEQILESRILLMKNANNIIKLNRVSLGVITLNTVWKLLILFVHLLYYISKSRGFGVLGGP